MDGVKVTAPSSTAVTKGKGIATPALKEGEIPTSISNAIQTIGKGKGKATSSAESSKLTTTSTAVTKIDKGKKRASQDESLNSAVGLVKLLHELTNDSDDNPNAQLALETVTSNKKQKRKIDSADEGDEARKKAFKVSEDEKIMCGDMALEEMMGEEDAEGYQSLFGDGGGVKQIGG